MKNSFHINTNSNSITINTTTAAIITNNIRIHMQGRIIHCAGCTMGGGSRRKGPPADQLPNFYHAVLTFER